MIVRLHEAVGNRTRITVRCDRPIAAASLCNLLEEPHAGIEVGDGICAAHGAPVRDRDPAPDAPLARETLLQALTRGRGGASAIRE